MAYPSPRQLQLRRGNTAAVSAYLGLAGEITINTDDWTIRVYDGVTPGGHTATVNTATIISSITSGNLTFGNLIPSANVRYSLGTITNQWKDLFVSNNTIYMGGIPLSIDAGGNLLVNGNVVQGGGTSGPNIGNLWVDSTTASPDVWLRTKQNNNIYISPDDINAIFVPTQASGSQTSLAGWGIGGTGVYSSNSYVQLDGYSWNSGIEVRTSWNNANHTWTFDNRGNLALPSGAQIGDVYGDGANYTSLQSAADGYMLLASNNKQQYVQVDDGSIYIGTDWPTHNYAWTFDKQGNITLPGGATIGVTATNTSIYTASTGSVVELRSNNLYNKVQVADDMVSVLAGDSHWHYDYYGKLTLPSGANITSYGGGVTTILDDNGVIIAQQNGVNAFSVTQAQGVRILSGGNPWQFYSDGSSTFPGNLTIQGNLIVNGNVSYINVNNVVIGDNIINLADLNPGDSLDLGFVAHRTPSGRPLQHTGLVRDAANNIWKLFSNVIPSPGATVDFTNAVYDDLRVGNITSPTITALTANAATQSDLIIAINANLSLANTIQSNQLSAANTAIVTANTAMKAYVDGQILAANTASYANAKVATYLQAGNIANISVAGNVTATYFVGNGALLTGVATGSSYSNVQVATYLPTYTGNLSAGNANIASNLTVGSYISTSGTGGNISGVNYYLGNTALITSNVYVTAGNVTAQYFIGNGAFLTGIVTSGAGGTNYSNVNVQAYTETMGFTNYSNVNTAAYLSGASSIIVGNTNPYSIQANNTTLLIGSNTAITNGGGTNVGATYILNNVYFDGNGQPRVRNTSGGGLSYFTMQGGTLYFQAASGSVTANATTAPGTVFQASTGGFSTVNSIGISAAGSLTTATGVLTTTAVTGSVFNTSANVINMGGLATQINAGAANVNLRVGSGTGNVTAGFFLGNGSQLTGIPTYSNVQVATYLPTYGGNITAQNITVSGNINLTGNILQINSAVFFGNTITGFNSLYAGIPGYTVVPQVVAQFTENFNGYAQLNSQNINSGNQASTDYIATANNGTDAAYFVDLGIAGSGYDPAVGANNNALGTVLSANDAYLYTAGNTAANTGGNLVIGVQTQNKTVKIFAGGVNANNVVLTIANTGITTSNVTADYYLGSGQFLSALPGYAYSNVNVKAYTEAMGFANYSNVNVAAYTSGLTNYSNVNTAAYLNSLGYNLYSNVNVAAYISTYTGAITGANLNVTGNILANGAVFSSQRVNGTSTVNALNATGNVVAQIGIFNELDLNGYLNSTGNVIATGGVFNNLVVNTGNINSVGGYFVGNGFFLTGIAASSNYSNVNVATYLPTYSGNIANVRLGVAGVLTFADGTTLASASAIAGSNYGNANVASYLITNAYVNTNSAYGNGNTASYLITNGYVNTNSAYGNGNVTSYLPTHSGNVGVNNLIGTTPNVTLVANSYSTTYDIYGNVAFGNALYPVQVYATGNISTSGYLFGNGSQLTGISSSYSNVQVAAYLAGPVTTGNLTVFGPNGLYFANITGVTTPAYGGSQTWRFFTQSAVSGGAGSWIEFPDKSQQTTAYPGANTAGVSSLTLNGNVTAAYFIGDGSQLTGIAGGGNYSNVNVAAYLNATGYNLYSNVNVATYLSGTSSVIVGNTNPYLIQANVTQVFVGNQLALYSGYGTTPTQATLSHNVYYDATGTQRYRNTQTGAAQILMSGASGFQFQGTTSSTTANAASGIALWAQITSTGIVTYNSLGITAAGSLTTSTGVLVSGATTGNLFNTVATTVNLGGAATAIAVGAANVVATFGGGTGNIVAGNITATQYGNSIGTTATYSGNITANNITATSNLTVGSYIATSGTGGNISGVNYYLGNIAVLTGNITAGGFVGTQYGNSIGTTATYSGNITVNGTAGIITPNLPAFRVYGINGQIDQRSANVNLKSPATVVQFNQGNYYNNTTGIFTAPVAGIYSVGLNARVGGLNGLSQVAVLKNGSNGTGNVVCWWESDTNAGSAIHFGVNGTVVLAAGEWLSANVLLGNIQFDNQDNWHVTYLG